MTKPQDSEILTHHFKKQKTPYFLKYKKPQTLSITLYQCRYQVCLICLFLGQKDKALKCASVCHPLWKKKRLITNSRTYGDGMLQTTDPLKTGQ